MSTRLLLFFLLFGPALSAQEYLRMIDEGTYPLQAIQQAAEAHFQVVGRERGSGYNPFKRWEYVASMELDANGVKIPNNDLALRARNYRRAEKLRQQSESGNAFNGDWKQLGPTYYNATSSWNPGVGRVTSIGLDEQNPLHVIIGSPTGGVWKTLDGCSTWTPLTDEFSTVDVYSLEISPYHSDHYLWGSTSGKVFRSVDGGQSWLSTGNLSGNGRVIRILYHPVDTNTVYAVSETNGLFRSFNGGQSWSAVPGVSGIRGYDIEFKPGDPQTIYFSGTAVFRSTNGGVSFSQINGFGTADNNYKMMGVSPANPAVVYVLESNGGRFGAFYKSVDSGATFNKLIDGADINFFGYSATGEDDRGQAPRDMDVAPHPYNAEEVHIAGIHTWKSTNGGVSFELTSYWTPGTAASLGVGYNHADIDILKFYGDTLYVGSDGGIYTSFDHAATFQDRSDGLGIREFYKIGVSKTNPNVVSGGSQDNGTSVMRQNNRVWVDWLGADGMETFVDWSNASILYGTSQYGSMYRSTNQGNSYNGISKPPDVEDGAWVTPFEQDPQVATTIYVAFEDVWKSVNSGNTWTKISDFASGDLNHLKLAPSNNQRIYAARGANLYTTANGGGSWTTITSAWGNSSINYIAVHPLDPLRLVVVTASNVYHSINAGVNWTNIGAGLPSGTKYCATWEDKGKNGLYVGGFGYVVYTNDDLNGQWVGFFDGLPNARVYELEINYISNTIFACTYGRGLWESPIYQLLPPAVAFTANQKEGCGSVTVQFTDQSEHNPTAWEWTFEGGTPASSNTQHPVVTFQGAGVYTVQLRAMNAAGENLLVKTDEITVFEPATPAVTHAERCEAGEVNLGAQAQPGEQLRWYTSAQGVDYFHTGEQYVAQLDHDTTFYVSAGRPYVQVQYLGPADNTFGGGGNHNGGYYLLLDLPQALRLKSVQVYAAGAADRVFQLRDATGAVVAEKTVYVPDGAQRVALDMAIPAGSGWQLGCPSPANLYRNNSGVQFPYVLPGMAQITGSTAGPDYYYYLYDLELEVDAWCESERAPVQATIQTPPPLPVLERSSEQALCSGDTLLLWVRNPCQGCVVNWSNGAVGDSLWVTTGGEYSATMINPLAPLCGVSPVSNVLTVEEKTLPDLTPVIEITGATLLCPGEELLLTVAPTCSDCMLRWSNGTVGDSLWVQEAGAVSAVYENICGAGPASDIVTIEMAPLPPAPDLIFDGSLSICPGDTLMLSVQSDCPDCGVVWSTGLQTPTIGVGQGGIFSAQLTNWCGAGPASAPLVVTQLALPETPVITVDDWTTFCLGDSVMLSAASACTDCSILWSTGATTPSIHVYNTAMITVRLQNECGLGPESVPISVIAMLPPSAPVIAPASDTQLCPGASLALEVLNDPCGGCEVHWSNGATGMIIEVSGPGVYSAMFLDPSNACLFGPASNAVEVTQLPEFLPVLTLVDSCTILAPAGSEYQWFYQGVAMLGENNQALQVAIAGLYSVSMLGPDGCAGQSAPVFAEACFSGLGGPAASAIRVNVYPNPAVQQAFLETYLEQNLSGRLDLYAMDGRLVGTLFDGILQAGKQTLSIGLPAEWQGIYLWRFTAAGAFQQGLMVIQR